MSTSNENLTADKITFRHACRENTGAHMLDSGGAYGRSHEKPEIPEQAPSVIWDAGCSATLETCAYLSERFEIDRELQSAWEAFDNEDGADLSWFESGAAFAESRGWIECGRDNTYNTESDLSQVFIWEVYSTTGETPSDYLYADDDTVTVLYIHTGCDVRGGYGRPIFCRAKGDYTVPVDACAEYWIESARNFRRFKYPRPVELFDACGVECPPSHTGPDTIEDPSHLCEEWGAGYSSYPYGQLEESVGRWFEFTRTADSVCVQLETGELARVIALSPYAGQ